MTRRIFGFLDRHPMACRAYAAGVVLLYPVLVLYVGVRAAWEEIGDDIVPEFLDALKVIWTGRRP